MFKKCIPVLSLIFTVFCSNSEAAILAAGAGYGGPTQAAAVCYLYNAGPTTIAITASSIVREPNISLPLSFSSCGANLAAGSSCGIASNIVNTHAHSCRFVVSTSAANVRGSLEFRNSSGTVLSNIPLK